METVTEKRKIMQTLPGSGELYWVEVDDDYQPEMKPINAPSRRVAGQHDCPHCGIVFNGPAVLDNHIKMSHLVASGSADMRAVKMPDGTDVPFNQVHELVSNAKDTKAEATAVLEENEKMKIQIAEQDRKIADLEAFASEKIAERFTKSGRPRKS